MIASLFLVNADQRPTAKEVLNHPWLIDVPLPREKKIPCPQIRAHSSQPQKVQEPSLIKSDKTLARDASSQNLNKYQTTQESSAAEYFG